METVGTIEAALERYSAYMTGVAYNTAKKRRDLDMDDLYQDFYIILHKLHSNPQYNSLPLLDFTKTFYTSINNFVANLFSQNRGRNRVKTISMDQEQKSPVGGKSKTMKDNLANLEFNDDDYKHGIIDILMNVSPDAGHSILDALNPDKPGNSSNGIKNAFRESKNYLAG